MKLLNLIAGFSLVLGMASAAVAAPRCPVNHAVGRAVQNLQSNYTTIFRLVAPFTPNDLKVFPVFTSLVHRIDRDDVFIAGNAVRLVAPQLVTELSRRLKWYDVRTDGFWALDMSHTKHFSVPQVNALIIYCDGQMKFHAEGDSYGAAMGAFN